MGGEASGGCDCDVGVWSGIGCAFPAEVGPAESDRIGQERGSANPFVVFHVGACGGPAWETLPDRLW
jgi:hypothetical protein